MPGINALDDLIRRLSGVSAWDSMAAISRQKGPAAGYASELLATPRAVESMGKVDQLLGDHGRALGPLIGRGRESLVFGTKGPGEGMVLKFQAPGAGRGFNLPIGVEGVAGYVAKERFPSGMQVAMQPRATSVLDPMSRAKFGGIAEESKWMQMADDVQRSLAARGYEWTDPHAGNVGIMPDGKMAAIDGALVTDEDLARLSALSPEEAIRLLRTQ